MQCFEENVRFNFHPNLSVPSVNANLFRNIKETFTLRHNKIIYCCFYNKRKHLVWKWVFQTGPWWHLLSVVVLYTDNESEKMTVYYTEKALSILLLYSVFFHLLDIAWKHLTNQNINNKSVMWSVIMQKCEDLSATYHYRNVAPVIV